MTEELDFKELTPWDRMWENIASARVERWEAYTKADEKFMKALRLAIEEYAKEVGTYIRLDKKEAQEGDREDEG